MIGVLTILFHVTCKATIPMVLLKIAMSYREPIRFCFIPIKSGYIKYILIFVHAINIIDYKCYINRELSDYGEET